MKQTVTIVTDDGYMKELPYSQEMDMWKEGMIVEVYHEEEKWYCEYRIVNIRWGKRNQVFVFDFVRTQKKRWCAEDITDAIKSDIASSWAKNLADEIDKKFIDNVTKIMNAIEQKDSLTNDKIIDIIEKEYESKQRSKI